MSNLVTAASRRSAALNPARKPATDWRSRLMAVPTRYKLAAVVCMLLSVLGWLGFASHQQAVEPVKLFAYKLTPRQLQECSQFLSKLGVEHRPSPDGDNLLVPPEKRLTLLNQIGAEQLPNEDKESKVMGLTPSRRELLSREQAELQLSLARTLQTMQGVDHATVQLAIPESSAFEDNNHPTASVVLTLRSGYEMSQRQSTGIHAVEVRRKDDGGCVAFQLMCGAHQLDAAAHQFFRAKPQPASVEKRLAKDLKRLFRPCFSLRLGHIGEAQLKIAQRNTAALTGHHKQHTTNELAQAPQHGQGQLGQHMHEADGNLAATHAFSPGFTTGAASLHSTRGCL